MNLSSVRPSRLPLRVRLVAGFSAATLVVLLVAGAVVYWRVEYALDRGLDTELAQAQQTLDPLVRADGEISDRSAAEATGVAWQVLDADGAVLDHGGPAGADALATQGQIAAADGSPRTYNVGDFLPASSHPYRLLVARSSPSPDRYLLVGVRRDHRDEALRELLLQLSLAGVGTLLVTAFVGDRLARAALLPVERYRRQAAAIAAGHNELRLDVPPVRDDEVTRLGHTFNDMLTTLDRALTRERQFVTEASHELRTPVALLKTRVQLARRKARTQAEHERVLADLEIDLERLARLAEQLLELGAERTESATVDLVAVVARIVENRAVELDCAAPSLAVRASDLEIERIVTNLLDNAVGHGAAPVSVAVDRPAEGWARVAVTDQGPGMPPDLLESATMRFARAEQARSRPGAGLGLAIVEALVVRAGAELRLCHDGRHTSHGRPAPVPCDHGPAMTASVLLPTASRSEA